MGSLNALHAGELAAHEDEMGVLRRKIKRMHDKDERIKVLHNSLLARLDRAAREVKNLEGQVNHMLKLDLSVKFHPVTADNFERRNLLLTDQFQGLLQDSKSTIKEVLAHCFVSVQKYHIGTPSLIAAPERLTHFQSDPNNLMDPRADGSTVVDVNETVRKNLMESFLSFEPAGKLEGSPTGRTPPLAHDSGRRSSLNNIVEEAALTFEPTDHKGQAAPGPTRKVLPPVPVFLPDPALTLEEGNTRIIKHGRNSAKMPESSDDDDDDDGDQSSSEDSDSAPVVRRKKVSRQHAAVVSLKSNSALDHTPAASAANSPVGSDNEDHADEQTTTNKAYQRQNAFLKKHVTELEESVKRIEAQAIQQRQAAEAQHANTVEKLEAKLKASSKQVKTLSKPPKQISIQDKAPVARTSKQQQLDEEAEATRQLIMKLRRKEAQASSKAKTLQAQLEENEDQNAKAIKTMMTQIDILTKKAEQAEYKKMLVQRNKQLSEAEGEIDRVQKREAVLLENLSLLEVRTQRLSADVDTHKITAQNYKTQLMFMKHNPAYIETEGMDGNLSNTPEKKLDVHRNSPAHNQEKRATKRVNDVMRKLHKSVLEMKRQRESHRVRDRGLVDQIKLMRFQLQDAQEVINKFEERKAEDAHLLAEAMSGEVGHPRTRQEEAQKLALFRLTNVKLKQREDGFKAVNKDLRHQVETAERENLLALRSLGAQNEMLLKKLQRVQEQKRELQRVRDVEVKFGNLAVYLTPKPPPHRLLATPAATATTRHTPRPSTGRKKATTTKRNTVKKKRMWSSTARSHTARATFSRPTTSPGLGRKGSFHSITKRG